MSELTTACVYKSGCDGVECAAQKNVTLVQFAITYLRVAIMTRVGAAGSPTHTHVESSE